MTESTAELPGSGHGSLPLFIFVGESEKQSRILVPHLSLVCMEISIISTMIRLLLLSLALGFKINSYCYLSKTKPWSGI